MDTQEMPQDYQTALNSIRDARNKMRHWALRYRKLARRQRTARANAIYQAVCWRIAAEQMRQNWIKPYEDNAA